MGSGRPRARLGAADLDHHQRLAALRREIRALEELARILEPSTKPAITRVAASSSR